LAVGCEGVKGRGGGGGGGVCLVRPWHSQSHVVSFGFSVPADQDVEETSPRR